MASLGTGARDPDHDETSDLLLGTPVAKRMIAQQSAQEGL
jgi:hypothetical protein